MTYRGTENNGFCQKRKKEEGSVSMVMITLASRRILRDTRTAYYTVLSIEREREL